MCTIQNSYFKLLLGKEKVGGLLNTCILKLQTGMSRISSFDLESFVKRRLVLLGCVCVVFRVVV